MVRYTNKAFYYFLATLLAVLILANVLTLFVNIFALIPLAFTGTVLYALITKQSWVRTDRSGLVGILDSCRWK